MPNLDQAHRLTVPSEICLEFSTLRIKEHKLYDAKSYDNHVNEGDRDNDGKYIFFHPYCKVDSMSMVSTF